MKELAVIYRGFGQSIPVGTLADDGKAVLFQYSADAIKWGLDLSPLRAPLRQAAFPDHAGDYRHLHDVPGLIYDSLPDGWGYRLMDRRMKARGLDPKTLSTLDRLAYLGSNTMGALVYQPAGTDLVEPRDLTLLALAQEVRAVQQDEGHTVLAELARAGGSPGGARPKAQVFFNIATQAMSTQASHDPGGEPWLVKFAASDDASDSVAVEALYAQMAQACTLGMAPTRLFDLPDAKWAFGTQRFDRRGVQRVHVHSLAGLLHANYQVPSVSYEDFFRATRRLTQDQRELVKAVKICAFNVLMNNRDDHSKNLSFIREADGRWVLAPPYDLTYNPGYRGEHFMDIAGEGKAPTRAHLVAAAGQAGLPAPLVNRVIDEVLDSATTRLLSSLATALPIRPTTAEMLKRAMVENRLRLTRSTV